MKKKGEVGYTFPNEKSEKSFRRNNWYQLNQIPLRVKEVGKLSLHKNKLNTILVDKDFDESISSIWEESNTKVGVKRDANFLNWRYRKPGTKYFKFILNSNQGLLVLKIFNQIEKNYVHICELLVKENNKEIISQALFFAEQFAKKNNCHFLTAWNDKNHEYSTYYDHFKMNLCSNTRYSYVYCDDEKFNNLKISQKWYLSQGDSDVY